MSSNHKTSVLIDSLLPDYLESEGPKFKAFIEAYYEWLETSNQVTSESKNLLSYQDIDDDLAVEFLEYFRREILDSFPKDILANKALLYKNIKDIYNAKGTENAYRLLFRVLYNEEISFYYPKRDILRTSDGRWVKETSIRLSAPFNGNLESLSGYNVIGVNSGATAKVERVVSTQEAGVYVYEAFLADITGTFLDGEKVETKSLVDDIKLSGHIIAEVGPLQNVIVTYGGAGHNKGDKVDFISASGTLANGEILSTDDTSLDFTIIDGGSGYNVGSRGVLTGGDGSGAGFSVSAINNLETILLYNDTIEPFANVPINTGPTFVSTGANTAAVSANIAVANASSILSSALNTSNLIVGSISALDIDRGAEYTVVPSISVTNQQVSELDLDDSNGGYKGRNAVITANTIPGSIASVKVLSNGSGYKRSDLTTIQNKTTSNTENAFGAPVITGVIEYSGAYIDTAGFLSWNNRLQDNYFYQDFSYVVRSTKALEVYKEIAYNTTHPTGTRLFGETRIEANIDFTTTINSIPVVRPFDIITPDILIPTVISTSNAAYAVAGPEGGVDPEPEVEPQLVSTIVFTDINTVDPLSDGYELEKYVVPAVQLTDVRLDVNKLILSVNIATTTAFGTTTFVSHIDPTSTFANNPEFFYNRIIADFQDDALSDLHNLDTFANTYLDAVTFPQQVGEHQLNMSMNPASVTSTVDVEDDGLMEIFIGSNVLISITSTTAVSTDSIFEITVDPTSATTVQSFGTSSIDFNIDLSAITSTSLLSTDNIIDQTLGGALLISIASTAVVSQANVVFQGIGTLTNLFYENIDAINGELISEFSEVEIQDLQGNRIFTGTSTQLTTDIANNFIISIVDVNGTGDEYAATVNRVYNDTSLSVSANVLYANGDLAIITDGTFTYIPN